ncbi:MAG: TonB-dependent receptor [Bacteroidales bacterium]|jgi:TonB-linked SusC/RagA family outer membrane protein|nr:TonB-dependent receptor [Bacteroidales bacterium]
MNVFNKEEVEYPPRNRNMIAMFRYVCFLACIGVFSVSTDISAQVRKVSLTYSNAPLKTILQALEVQSEYSFVYSDEIDTEKAVSVNVTDQEFGEALKTLFAAAGLNYRITDTYVVVYKSGEKASQPPVVQQNIRIAGAVTDGGGDPIPGVNIVVKGTTQGVISDAAGQYVISVPDKNSVLVFSFVGYATQEIPVGEQISIDVSLSDDAQEIEEVVVVGYGVQKKESSVAAIGQVKGDDMLKMSATNIPNALAGQVTGVSVIQASGKPGDDVGKIFIRGVSTWQATDPLVLVDGVERRFNNIDPNEIETLSVLKDASATAIFGVRGANGVILITTKRGTKGEVKVNATAEFIAKEPIGMIAPLDSYTTGLVMNEAYKNDNNWANILSDEILEHYRVQDLPYIYPNTNWQEEMLKKVGFSHKYNVNISGGTDFARVFASLSYLYDGDILKTEKQPEYDPTYKFNRYNYRFNIDSDLTKTTVLTLEAGGFISIINQPYNTYRPYRAIYMLGPMEVPLEYPAEVLEQYPDPWRPDETGVRQSNTGQANAPNPYVATNYSGSRSTKRTDLNVTLRLKQELDFITKGLSVAGKVAYNHNMAYVKGYAKNYVSYNLDDNGNWTRYVVREVSENPETPVNVESESVSSDPYRTWYYEASINYARKFGKHDVGGLVLGQRRQRQTNVEFPRYEEGVVGRVTYDYDTRYLLEVNMAYNGSEQFAPKNRYGFFPSYAVGWNLHNEKFFQPVKNIVSRAKVRMSYGEVGSDAGDRWLYTSSYVNGGQYTDKYYPGTLNASSAYITPIIEENAANDNARWERAVKKDVGVELAFLHNSMFVLSMDFYREDRDQILLSRLSLPAWFGVGSKQQNLGKTETKGYEIELKFQQTTSGGFYYWLKPAVSFSDNRIIEKDEPMYSPEYQKQAGKRIWQEMGYVSTGMIQNTDEQMNSIRYGGSIMGLGDSQWMDFNGDGVIDTYDQVPIGYSTQYPLYNYSFGGGFRIKNFEFDFLFQGVSHYSKVVIDAFAWPLHRLANHVFAYQMDAWNPDNRDAQFPSYHFDATRTHNNLSDGAARTTNLYDASFIRLKSVNLSYSLPKSAVNRMKLDRLSVFLRGSNLFTWSPNYPLADPEGSDGSGRVTDGYYPLLRRYTLGLQITF